MSEEVTEKPEKKPRKPRKSSKPKNQKLDLLDILPELQELAEAPHTRRYRLGLTVRSNDATIFSGNKSKVLAYFAGGSPTRDPYFFVHNGLFRSLLGDSPKPFTVLTEFMAHYG